ncbi:unnamed protein product [Colias eurytheme]|nr:unnamed protein product [Colias eurytheme]
MFVLFFVVSLLSGVYTQCVPCQCLSADINPFQSVLEYFDSSVSCLQPTITPYGTITEVPVTELPRIISPMLPAASPVSALAPPFLESLPPASHCYCACQYLKKMPIPPPFI